MSNSRKFSMSSTSNQILRTQSLIAFYQTNIDQKIFVPRSRECLESELKKIEEFKRLFPEYFI